MYYFWRLLGYKEEDLTYLTRREVLDVIEVVAKEREEKKTKQYNTRYANATKNKLGESIMLNTKFKDDLENALKARWKGIKGLDETKS